MNEETWTKVDHYFSDKLLPADAVLAEALSTNLAAGLPAIDVTPLQGKFLHLLAKLQGARRILEIGTLGGYSTLWLARALPPGGQVVSLELEEKHVRIAVQNIQRAGLSDRVQIRQGNALNALAELRAEPRQPFDFVFIDADKVNTSAYFQQAVELCRSGSVIIADNTVRKGQVIEAAIDDINVQGMRQFIEALASDSWVEATAVQTVGAKGYDGFILIRVL